MVKRRARRRVMLGACALVWLGAQLGRSPPASAVGPARDDGDSSVTVLGRGTVRWRTLRAADRATLLVFATTWCAACRREQPQVLRWARAQAAAVRTLYVYSGSSAAEVRRKLAEHRLETDPRALPIVVDAEGSVAARYAIRSTPTLLHLRADGRLIGRYRSIDELPPPERARRVVQRSVVVRDSGRELGTSYEVWLLVAPSEVAHARRALAAARVRVHELEQQLSEWRDDSEISRVNRLAGTRAVELSETLAQLVRGSLGVSQLTGGAFDITWAPIDRLWREAVQRQVWPDDQALHRALQAVGYQGLRLEGRTIEFQRAGMAVGIGGVAKGWIVDAVHALLRARGLRDIVVKIGGDMRTSGRDADGNKHAFHLADPYHLGRSAGSLRVADTAIATSGNYLRHERIDTRTVGHIVDPRSGRPPAFDGSVTVLTRDSALADALSTALFVMGPEHGLRFARGQAGVEVLYLTRHGPVGTLPAP